MKIPNYRTAKTLAFFACTAMIIGYWLELVDPIINFLVIFSLGAFFAYYENSKKI